MSATPPPIANPMPQPAIKSMKRKRKAYEQRIREIEHSSLTPLVMASTGGLGPAASLTYKRLATLLAVNWNQTYSTTLSWLRCRLSFCLLRSSIQAIRGARSSGGRAIKVDHLPTDLVQRVSSRHSNGHCQLNILIHYLCKLSFHASIVLVPCNSKVYNYNKN